MTDPCNPLHFTLEKILDGPIDLQPKGNVMKNRMSVMLAVFVAICLITPIAVSGSPATELVEKNVITQWRSIKKKIPRITVGELKTRMDNGETFVLLDVRKESDFLAGHLPGALHINRGELEFAVATAIPNTETRVYVYCRTGIKATFAARTLIDIGYTNVARVADSFKGWLEAGYPVYNRHGAFVLQPNGFEKKE
jgi:rhodanese-related sulfurtransferase